MLPRNRISMNATENLRLSLIINLWINIRPQSHEFDSKGVIPSVKLARVSFIPRINRAGGPPFGIPKNLLHYGIRHYSRTSDLN